MVKILAQTPAGFDFDVKVRDAQSRTHTVAARLDYQPAHVVARVARLTLDLPDGTWRLSQPVTVEQRDQDFLVDRLLMRNNGRELFLDGQFSLTGSQALRLNVEKLPIEGLRAFLPELPDVTGILSAQVQLGGTAAAPQVVAALSLENSKIAGHSYAGLVASGSYRDQKAEVKATVQQDQAPYAERNRNSSDDRELEQRLACGGGGQHRLSYPVFRFEPGFSQCVQRQSHPGDRRRSRGGSTSPRFTGPTRWPVDSYALRDGKLTPTALGVQVSSITAEGLLEPRGIRVSQISARANKGELNGNGFIALQKFVPQGIDLTIAAKQWPAINTQQYQIEVDGAAKIDGTLAAPRITGKFEVPRGELRPDLSFLDRGNTPVKRDPTITVVSTTAAGNACSQAREQRSSRQ